MRPWASRLVELVAPSSIRLPRVVLASVASGVIIGLVVAGFERLAVEVLFDHLREQPLWLAAAAPSVALVASALILRVIGGPDATSSTSDEYIRAFHDRTVRLPLRHLPAKLLAGASSIGGGLAMGLEGPSIYAGATIGHHIQTRVGRFFRREEAKVLLTAGAAAGVAAIFKTPATGLIFALEAPYRDDVARRALLPSLLAAASSYLVFVALLDTDPVFPTLGRTDLEVGIDDLLGGALIGLGAGLGGRATAALVRAAKQAAQRYPLWQRILVAGVALGGLAVASDGLFDEPLTLGPGVNAVEWLIADERGLGIIAGLFAFRMLATLTSIVGGGTGGLFIPLAVQGVIMGSFIGAALNRQDSSLYPTIGLAAFLGAGYRTPIAAVMFVAESTGGRGASPYVVPALIAAAMSQLVAGSSSVASYQRDVRLGHLERRFTLPITSALSTDVLTVPPDATASEFVFVHVLGRRERTVPVVDDDRYLGMCDLDTIGAIDRDAWDETAIRDVMRTDLPVATTSWTLRDAVAAMERANVDLLPLADEHGWFVGVVSADDIVKLDEILDDTGA